MAVISFPSSPSLNDQYSANGIVYTWDGNAWTAATEYNLDLDIRYVETGGDTMTGNLTVPSLNGGPLAGSRNALLNPYHEITQRGLDEFDVGGLVKAYYTGSDRWVVMPTVSNTLVTTRVYQGSQPTSSPGRNALYLSADGSSGGTFNVGQFIELTTSSLGAFQPGTKWTLRVLIQAFSSFDVGADLILSGGSNLSSTGVTSATPVTLAGTGYQECVFNFTIPDDGSWVAGQPCLLVRLNISNGSEAREVWIGSAQLEPGPISTPWEYRPIQTELAACQRYYQAFDYADGPFLYLYQHSPSARSTTGFFPTEMRADPTLAATISSGTLDTVRGTAKTYYVKADISSGTTTTSYVNSFTADAEL